jgi:hypothetical protein
MRPELVVGAGAALLIGALAGVEWWAEHRLKSDEVAGWLGDRGEVSVSDSAEADAFAPSASPRLSR